MAIRVDFLLKDDLDGTVSPDVSTVMFGLDGSIYAIDLTVANAARLRRHLAAFVEAARRIGLSTHSHDKVRGRPVH
jgi:hypothetical protein